MRRLLLAIVVLLLGLGIAAAPAQATPTDRAARRVVLVSVPTLTWGVIQQRQPPVITRFVHQSAVASMSVRTIGPRTSVGEGYVTLGAGNRATVRLDSANAAYGPEDEVEDSKAALVYERRTGVPATGNVLQVEIVDVLRSATRLRYGAEPGALSDALKAGGKSSAVIANADGILGRSADAHREAALAMMDGNGQVVGGSVDQTFSVAAPDYPFGLRADASRINSALDLALRDHDAVLVEAGDYARLDRYRVLMTERAQALAEQRALASADRLMAAVLERVDLARDLVVLLAPSAPASGEQLTAFAIAGPGFAPGWAESATTRRAGFVTLPDVAPTVLHALGIKAPDSMTGTLMSSDASGSPDAASITRMVRVDTLARFRDRAVGPLSVAFIVVQVLVYALATIAVSSRRDWLRSYVSLAALVVLAVPPVAFLSGLMRYDALGQVGYPLTVFAVAVLLAGAARAAGRGRTFMAPGLLIGLTLSVLLVDIVSGGRLQINTVFGYSPIVAGRFAGYGNLAFALVAMAALVLGTIVWAAPRMRGSAAPVVGVPLALAALLFVVVLFLDGFPSFGSDVGGVLATLPAFAVTLLVLVGIRVSWPRFVAIGAGSIGVVGVLAAIDMARPEQRRTHLGRFAQRLLDGDAWVILERKVNANLSLLTSSVWTYVIPVALAFLAFLTWRPSGFLRELQRSVPGVRACLVGSLVAGVLGFALNDSGVAIPAMMFGILLPYLTWLLLQPPAPVSARAEVMSSD